MEGKDLNRLKLVLVEKKRTGLWLAEQLGVSNTACFKVVQQRNPTFTTDIGSDSGNIEV